MSEPKRWACSIVAIKQTPENTEIQALPFIVEAVSKLEAEGLAMRIVRKLFPGKDGWSSYDAKACGVDRVITLESACLANR